MPSATFATCATCATGISGIGLCKVSDPQELIHISSISLAYSGYLFVALQLPQFQHFQLALGHLGQWAVAFRGNAAPVPQVDQCFKSADLSNSDAADAAELR